MLQPCCLLFPFVNSLVSLVIHAMEEHSFISGHGSSIMLLTSSGMDLCQIANTVYIYGMQVIKIV